MNMYAKVLVIGNGGREHALVWKLAQSPQIARIFIAPGNPGCSQETTADTVCECIDIATHQHQELVNFAVTHRVDLVVIGPEVPIAAGLGDAMRQHNIACVAPDKQAAMLESSKVFCKQLLIEHNIPTAKARAYCDYESAVQALQDGALSYPLVIKSSGLAAGKGVVIVTNKTDALAAVHSMMVEKHFASAGDEVLIEDYLHGQELSYIVLCDGKTFIPLASSQDHKRLLEGDNGPNTGGMGAYSPAPMCDAALTQRIHTRVIAPTLQALAQKGIFYQGFLYAGLMIDANGMPHVLEYNCRLGDPETQSLLMRMQSDLYPLLVASTRGQLAHVPLPRWHTKPSVGVVIATQGYPHKPCTGQKIYELPRAIHSTSMKIFHAGTCVDDNGSLRVSAGRILCVSVMDATLKRAQQKAVDIAKTIRIDGKHFRKDIGWQAIPPDAH